MAAATTFREIDAAIRLKYASEGLQSDLRYDPKLVREGDHWWYVPCGWIGSLGCIVDKRDLYVNCLGSGLSLDMCIWGHEHGIFHDLVDFTFAQGTDLNLAAALLLRFQHTRPNAAGMRPNRPVWYRYGEIASALSTQFPIFRRHFVWSGIPEIRDAHERDGMSFASTLSKVAEPAAPPNAGSAEAPPASVS